MRRAIVVACAALTGACWSWDALLAPGDASTPDASFCTNVDAKACVDFDEAQFNGAWDISKNGFTPTYAEVDDAAAHSPPRSLLVHIDAGSTGISTYAQLTMTPGTDAPGYTFDFWIRNEALTGATEARFFGIVASIIGSDGGPSEYQLSVGGGPTPDATRVVEQAATYASHTLADAGIAFPIGEWRRVHIVAFTPNDTTLTLQVTSEDGGTASASVPLTQTADIDSSSKWCARFGGFIVSPNVVWSARYDSITASW